MIEEQLSPLSVESFDLRESNPNDLAGHSLLIFGSPTYGTGDWHYLWQTWTDKIFDVPIDWEAQKIGLFALGDVRHHKDSFAGALTHLRALVHKLGALLVGQVEYDDSYDREACEALLRDSCFPGLILDQVTQRRISPQRIRTWASLLKVACHSEPQ